MKGRSKVEIWKPTAAQIAASYGRSVPDLIAPNLAVLFVGINPGLYSAAVGHHFARPGNRFWPTLHLVGYSRKLLSPFQERELLGMGYGITNLVARATGNADELTAEELTTGARILMRKVRRLQPAVVAFLGISAYRVAFHRLQARFGEQEERIGASRVWILPNPSGLNAHYQLPELARLYAELRGATMTPNGVRRR